MDVLTVVLNMIHSHVQVESAAYSSNGEYIASGSDNCTIQIWNVETGEPVGQPMEGHTGTVHSVVYAPDGKYIASGSLDCTIRIWDIETGEGIV